jgi:hypothetical protein
VFGTVLADVVWCASPEQADVTRVDVSRAELDLDFAVDLLNLVAL